MAATAYIILHKAEDERGWTVAEKTVTASSADAAIREAAATDGFPTVGEYAAVPARSWQPRQLTVESKPKVTFA